MKKKIISFLPYFLISIIALFLLKDLFKLGFPYTHDGHNHLARLANLWLILKSGQIPPRFAPNLDYNFGYPVFNFNYYFSYFFALIFRAFKFSFESSLKANIIIFYTLGGLGIFQWLKKHLKTKLAFLASILYLTFPYQLTNIFIRGNIGESAALGTLPWVLYFIDKINKKYSSLIYLSWIIAFFWLTHNLVTILGLPLIAVYYFFNQRKTHSFKKTIQTGFLISIISASLVSFFYLPALFEKKYITLDKLSLNTQYDQHFVYPLQLIKDNWQFGYSLAGDQDTMPLSLGVIHFSLSLIGLIVFILQKKPKNQKLTRLFLFITLVSIFMLLPSSHLIYQFIPALTYLQFPWRWFLVICLSLPVFISSSFSGLKNQTLILFIVVAVTFALFYKVSPWTKITNSIHHTNQDYHDFFFTSSVLQENTNIWFDRTKNLELPTQYAYERLNHVQPQISTWNAKEHLYIMNYDQPMNVLERTAYFPGWKVYVDNRPVEINYQDKQFPGIITFSLPAGEHFIKTIFTQQTLPRLIGNTLSIITFFGSLTYLILKKLKK